MKRDIYQKELKKEEEVKSEEKTEALKRQIIIETDGTTIRVAKAEVAGALEFRAILESLLNSLLK